MRPQRPAQLDFVGDDVVAIAPRNRSDRHHDAAERIDLACNDVLQGQHDRGRSRERVDGLVRIRAVAAHALDVDVEFVGGGTDRPGRYADRADIQPRVDVQHRDEVDGRLIEDARFDHRQRAARPFFCRLKDQHDAAAQPLARTAQHRAAPSSIAVCASWPQACIFPSTRDA